MTTAKVQILLIEDNSGDILLLKKGLEKANANYDMQVITDGEEARSLLTELAMGKKPLPQMIILDLNLPKVNGHALLKLIKESEVLLLLPVIIFSSSRLNSDMEAVYKMNANCYIEKPFELDKYQNVVETMWGHWSEVISLPPWHN